MLRFFSPGRLAACAALVASLACGETSPEDRCDAPTKEECLKDGECAWGTSRDGPSCFWVGEVKPQAAAAAPACHLPAPVDRAGEGAIDDEWIVMVEPDVDFDSVADDLAQRHRLVIRARLWIAHAFVARAEEETVARLRCEPSVRRLTQNRTSRALAR